MTVIMHETGFWHSAENGLSRGSVIAFAVYPSYKAQNQIVISYHYISFIYVIDNNGPDNYSSPHSDPFFPPKLSKYPLNPGLTNPSLNKVHTQHVLHSFLYLNNFIPLSSQ